MPEMSPQLAQLIAHNPDLRPDQLYAALYGQRVSDIPLTPQSAPPPQRPSTLRALVSFLMRNPYTKAAQTLNAIPSR